MTSEVAASSRGEVPHADVVIVLRPRYGRGIAAAVVVLLLVAAGVLWGNRYRGGDLNVAVADSVEVFPLANTWGFSPPGTIVISGNVGIVPSAPITLLDVKPYRITPDTELLAVRVFFQGRGSTSPSGHRLFTGVPGGVCYNGPWPPEGYGPSYPVRGIKLAKGDPVVFGYYSRGPDKPGDYVVTGYRIRYRTASGKVRTVFGDGVRNEMNYRLPPDLVGKDGQCRPKPESGFARAWPGYPN